MLEGKVSFQNKISFFGALSLRSREKKEGRTVYRHVGEGNFQRKVEKRHCVGNEDVSEKCIFNAKS